jgi:hypothetical protein
MNAWSGLLLLTGYYPLLRARAANGNTTLRPALRWAAAAWTAWVAAAFDSESLTLPYLALCLSGCAGVAVLGARRPGVGAWNFVVGGLLVVLLLPVASGLGTPRLEPAHLVFLSATLIVVLLNYLPTRPGVAVLPTGVAFALEVTRLAGVSLPEEAKPIGRALLTLAPWMAWLAQRRRAQVREVDCVWFGFRDRYGFLWAERVREQFNRSATSAGWSAKLGWSGLRTSEADDAELLRTLQALLKRFGPPDAT